VTGTLLVLCSCAQPVSDEGRWGMCCIMCCLFATLRHMCTSPPMDFLLSRGRVFGALIFFLVSPVPGYDSLEWILLEPSLVTLSTLDSYNDSGPPKLSAGRAPGSSSRYGRGGCLW